jgi:hypothetical protein
LTQAALQALACSREEARRRALSFGWQEVAQQFRANLVVACL